MTQSRFAITSPTRELVNTPLTLTIRGLQKPEDGDWALENEETGELLALQPETGWFGSRAILRFILPRIGKGQTLTFRLTQAPAFPSRVSAEPLENHRLRLSLDGQEVTCYHYADTYARPFLWPLIGPDGVRLSRDWTMEEREGDQQDHIHHRSMWSAHGDLNGTDNWTEMEGHGSSRHYAFEEQTSGPVFGRFSAKHEWLTAEGQAYMRAYIDVTLYAIDGDARMLDYTICFRPLSGPVRFGDTKEGGIIAVRVASSMCGQNGGLIENAYGGLTERECWGRPAPWVDYSGTAGSDLYGITLMEHPENPQYPTRWHVRDYGLFAANPFALHDYLGSDQVDGSAVLEPGQVWKYAYRVVLHRGRAADAAIRDRFLAFAEGLEIKPIE